MRWFFYRYFVPTGVPKAKGRKMHVRKLKVWLRMLFLLTLATIAKGQSDGLQSAALVHPEHLISATNSSSGLKQFPIISRTHIAFIYANDLWIAPRDGGVAVPLT